MINGQAHAALPPGRSSALSCSVYVPQHLLLSIYVCITFFSGPLSINFAVAAIQVLQLGRDPDHHSDGGGQRRGPGVGRQGGAHVHAGSVGGAPGEGGRGRLRRPRAYGKVRGNEGGESAVVLEEAEY